MLPMSKFSGKFFIIARHEFLKTVTRKEFLFMTFIFPIFMAGIIFVPALLASTTPVEDQKIGYIDQTNSFVFPDSFTKEGFSVGPLETKTSTIYFVKYENSSEALYSLEEGQISSYFVIPQDFIKIGIIELYSSGKGVQVPRVELLSALSDTVITSLLKGKVDEPVLNRVKEPVNLKLFSVGESGKPAEKGISEILADFGLPFLIAFILFFSIFSASGYLLRSVAEEKETRIIEVLLSSATPTELLIGKIFGLGAAGLLQIAVWLSAVSFGSLHNLPVKIEPALPFIALIYFLLGFLFFASMMAGIGAVTVSLHESQQIGGFFTFLAAFPLIFIQLILTKPDSPLVVFLSFFPFTSPVTMLARIGASEVPFYQIAASILILGISVCGVIMLSSRLFRAYLLMYGKRPGVKLILKSIMTNGR
jgi:ABC-2 type transport system permease protein